MTQTRQYDLLDRLTSIASVGTGSTPSLTSFAYQYNQANQRTRATLQDASFWIYVNNTGSVVWTNIPVTTSGGGSVSGKVYVPQAPEAYQYDLDGNLLQDGRWTYTWDAENRLIKIEPLAPMPEADKRRGNYAYDHQGRRIWKGVDYRSGGNWTTHHERKFVYDGWNLTVELFTNNTAAKRFLWGLDLSGSEQGAGGVGGLLKVWDHCTANHCFMGYDGNGNMAALVAQANGSLSARYEYGPFGETLRATGRMARHNPFRFSTQYTDNETMPTKPA